jgi:hypothetical protein
MLTVEQRDEFLKTLHNPQYVNLNHIGPIALTGTINGQKLIFYASPYDTMEYGKDIYNRVIKGEYGEIGEFVPEIISQQRRTSDIHPMTKIIEDLRKEIEELKREMVQLKAQK